MSAQSMSAQGKLKLVSWVLLSTLSLSACDTSEDDSSSPTPEETPTPTAAPSPTPASGIDPDTPGTLNIAFRMDDDVVEQLYLLTGEESVGMFYGAMFWTEDVSDSGPSDDAEIITDFELYVDLRPTGETTAVLQTVSDLKPGDVTILGFLDTDGNASSELPMTDPNDPVTKPGYNKFTVLPGKTSDAVVFFNFLFPSK